MWVSGASVPRGSQGLGGRGGLVTGAQRREVSFEVPGELPPVAVRFSWQVVSKLVSSDTKILNPSPF